MHAKRGVRKPAAQILRCLCQNDLTGCGVCAAAAAEQWVEFSNRNPHLSPGQLLEQAIQQGQDEVVLGILQHTDISINEPCDPQRHGSVSPLMTALRTGRARTTALIAGQPRFDLARSLTDYDTWSWVRSSSLEVLQQYLGICGSNVNQKDGNGKTLLHEAVYDLSSQDKLRVLVSQPGIEVDAQQVDGTTPLYRAVLAGNTEAFKLLLSKGADANNRNNDNHWSILILAAAENRIATVELLLRRREVDVNAVDDIGNAALHVAADRGHSRAVQLLTERPDCNVNLKNYMGWTPLAKAAFAGHTEVVRLLTLRTDIEVNFVDQDRQTPLFHAVSAGNLEVVRLLLADPRINVGIRNRPARHTALDMAVALGFEAMAELISRHDRGADALSGVDSYVERKCPPRRTTFLRPPRDSR